jgi:hypothetical protein
MIMKDSKTLLNERLKLLKCDKVPSWLPAHLLPLVEAEITRANNKIEQQMNRRIARIITVNAVAAAFLAGPPADGEGSKGEDNVHPLLPTVK